MVDMRSGTKREVPCPLIANIKRRLDLREGRRAGGLRLGVVGDKSVSCSGHRGRFMRVAHNGHRGRTPSRGHAGEDRGPKRCHNRCLVGAWRRGRRAGCD